MDKFPLYFSGRSVGELTVTREGLYDCFRVECHPPEAALYRAFAVGESGRLRLGVLEPEGDVFGIRRRFPIRESAGLGKLLHGELLPCGREETSVPESPDLPPLSEPPMQGDWKAAPPPERMFRSPFLREQLRDIPGILARQEGGCRFVALPYHGRRPFLLSALFCFARICSIGGKEYAVFAFDRDENPVFR